MCCLLYTCSQVLEGWTVLEADVWMLTWRQISGPSVVEATVFGTHKSAAAGDFDGSAAAPWAHQRRAVSGTELPAASMFLRTVPHMSGVVVLDIDSRVWVGDGSVRRRWRCDSWLVCRTSEVAVQV